MFSLIITIVSIVLVLALAAATIYYGGDSSSTASARASAAALVNQATQIAAAGTLTDSRGEPWPAAAPIFGQPFLAAMPIPPRSAYAAGEPAVADWVYYRPGQANHFMLENKISKEVCLAVNRSQGFIGIPAAWDGKSLIQCFGRGVTMANGKLAYTFFYDPIKTTPSQDQDAVDKSVTDANSGTPAPTPVAVPGYPRLCPDESVISSGVCIDPSGGGSSAPGGSTGGGGTPVGGGGSGGAIDPGESSDPFDGSSGPSGGSGGSSSETLTCTGVYSDSKLTANCSFTRSAGGNPLIVQEIYAVTGVAHTRLTGSASDCVDGSVMAAGSTCTFDYVGTYSGGKPASSPAVYVKYTYGETGTEAQSERWWNGFTYEQDWSFVDNFDGTGAWGGRVSDSGHTWVEYSTGWESGTAYMTGTGTAVANYHMHYAGVGGEAGRDYYIEYSFRVVDNNPEWTEDMVVSITDGSHAYWEAGYYFYMYGAAQWESEIDFYVEGNGGGYYMDSSWNTGLNYVHRLEVRGGELKLFINGAHRATFNGATTRPDQIGFQIPPGIALNYVRAQYL